MFGWTKATNTLLLRVKLFFKKILMLATFMKNDGNINVRDEMRRNPQGMVNLARRMFGV